MTDAATWVQAGTTLALLGVTRYYAKKTNDMADSAKESVRESAKGRLARIHR